MISLIAPANLDFWNLSSIWISASGFLQFSFFTSISFDCCRFPKWRILDYSSVSASSVFSFIYRPQRHSPSSINVLQGHSLSQVGVVLSHSSCMDGQIPLVLMSFFTIDRRAVLLTANSFGDAAKVRASATFSSIQFILYI